jgi:hypothetical protein
MFPAEVYIQRRKRLRELVGKGVILFLGNKEVAINYGANNYPFRQDSSFLYYFGLDLPGLAGMIDCEMAVETLYGSDPTLEDIIWVGNHEPLQELLNQSIEDLDAESRALVEGKYLRRASVRALALESGLTEKAVESRLLRARRELRGMILKKLRHENIL